MIWVRFLYDDSKKRTTGELVRKYGPDAWGTYWFIQQLKNVEVSVPLKDDGTFEFWLDEKEYIGEWLPEEAPEQVLHVMKNGSFKKGAA